MTNFDIGVLHPNTPHLFADLAELLLVVNYFGRSYLHPNDLEGLLHESIISSEEIDEEDAVNSSTQLRSSADRNSRHDRQIEDVMTQLDYRHGSFKDWYPFEIKEEKFEIFTSLSNKQRVYRFLLACSRLRSFNGRGISQRWAKHFTVASKFALQSMAPVTANTRIFDANSDDRRSYYGTDLRAALKKMGQDLGVLKINHEECEHAGSSGDAGFDLISSLEFNDGAATNFALLGQCGAQEREWPKKTLEAHSIRTNNFFQKLFDYPSAMFTPVSYRSSTGEWVNNSCANGIILLDRKRLLHLLTGQEDIIVSESWFSEFEEELLSHVDYTIA